MVVDFDSKALVELLLQGVRLGELARFLERKTLGKRRIDPCLCLGSDGRLLSSGLLAHIVVRTHGIGAGHGAQRSVRTATVAATLAVLPVVPVANVPPAVVLIDQYDLVSKYSKVWKVE